MSSVGIDILQGYSVRVLVGFIARNLLKIQNGVGGNGATAPRFVIKQLFFREHANTIVQELKDRGSFSERMSNRTFDRVGRPN